MLTHGDILYRLAFYLGKTPWPKVEFCTTTGDRVDIVRYRRRGYRREPTVELYEIKTLADKWSGLRDAIGQLQKYAASIKLSNEFKDCKYYEMHLVIGEDLWREIEKYYLNELMGLLNVAGIGLLVVYEDGKVEQKAPYRIKSYI